MKFKIEFEIEETSGSVTEEEIREFLEFELGVRNSMNAKSPIKPAQLISWAENVKITKIAT